MNLLPIRRVKIEEHTASMTSPAPENNNLFLIRLAFLLFLCSIFLNNQSKNLKYRFSFKFYFKKLLIFCIGLPTLITPVEDTIEKTLNPAATKEHIVHDMELKKMHFR
jgi:hypothetical protein